jgi:hypothetical protein
LHRHYFSLSQTSIYSGSIRTILHSKSIVYADRKKIIVYLLQVFRMQ